MNDLKFTCPSCGQHIQCEQTHAGEKIPCPSCAVLVRVPADAAPVIKNSVAAANPPAAATPGIGTTPTLEENFLAEESGAPLPTNPPVTEREQQIAAARAAHAAHVTQIKPRLSFILSGGEAPPPEENESALTNGEQKHSDHPDSETKTVHE